MAARRVFKNFHEFLIDRDKAGDNGAGHLLCAVSTLRTRREMWAVINDRDRYDGTMAHRLHNVLNRLWPEYDRQIPDPTE